TIERSEHGDRNPKVAHRGQSFLEGVASHLANEGVSSQGGRFLDCFPRNAAFVSSQELLQRVPCAQPFEYPRHLNAGVLKRGTPTADSRSRDDILSQRNVFVHLPINLFVNNLPFHRAFLPSRR